MNEAMETSHETLTDNADPVARAAFDEQTDGNKDEAESAFAASAEGTAHADPSLGELDTLRTQVAQLRQLLEQKEQEQATALRELEDFHRLFPKIPIRAVPETVWQSRQNGLPLNAAYALYECEQAQKAAHAEEVNRANAVRSAGTAGTHTAKEYFSADEVRAMTPRQVHENYAVIRASMRSW